jgi:hypothetical protein
VLGVLLAVAVFSRAHGMLDPEVNDYRVWPGRRTAERTTA